MRIVFLSFCHAARCRPVMRSRMDTRSNGLGFRASPAFFLHCRDQRPRSTLKYGGIPSAFLEFPAAEMHNRPMIDWNDLRYLLAVARGGSTAAAARTLGVNQSTVVRRIGVLEQELGFRLFDKKRDGYRLTSEGAALLEEASAVEASVMGFMRRAGSLGHLVTGSLRVTVPEGIGLTNMLSPLLNEFHHRYPELRVNLIIDNRVLDLGKAQVDVALRAGDPRDPTLIGRKLVPVAWAVYASCGHVARCGVPAAPEDMNGRPVIGFDGELEDIPVARWLREVAPRAEIPVRCTTFFAVLSAVKSGLGYALLPCHIGDIDADLVRVIGPLPALTGHLWILTHPELHRTPKVRAFFDFMVAEIEPYKPLMIGETRGPVRVDRVL